MRSVSWIDLNLYNVTRFPKKVRRRVRNHLLKFEILDCGLRILTIWDFGLRILTIWDFGLRISDFNNVRYLILYWLINFFCILYLAHWSLHLIADLFPIKWELSPFNKSEIRNLKSPIEAIPYRDNPKSHIRNPKSKQSPIETIPNPKSEIPNH